VAVSSAARKAVSSSNEPRPTFTSRAPRFIARSTWLRSNVSSRGVSRRGDHDISPRGGKTSEFRTGTIFSAQRRVAFPDRVTPHTRISMLAHAVPVLFRSTRIPQSKESSVQLVNCCGMAHSACCPRSLCPGIGQNRKISRQGKSASPSCVPPSERKNTPRGLSPEFSNRQLGIRQLRHSRRRRIVAIQLLRMLQLIRTQRIAHKKYLYRQFRGKTS